MTCWALRRVKRRYVLTLHGGSLPEFAERNSGRVRRLLNSAAAVTVPSRYLAPVVERARGDYLLIPNPVDLQAYAFRPRPTPSPRLLWLRAFHAAYNPEVTLEAFCLLRESHPAATLTMVGPDKGDGTWQKVALLVRRRGLENSVHLIGQVPRAEVQRQLAAHDIFINSTDVDNTPVSVLEAMAAGLCIVSTNVGGIPFLLQDEKTALLVPPRNAPALAEAVRRLLATPALASRLSSAGYAAAVGNDWTSVLPQWQELLRSVAAGGRSQSR